MGSDFTKIAKDAQTSGGGIHHRMAVGHSAAPEYVDEQAAGQQYRRGPEDRDRPGCRVGCARRYRSANDRGSCRHASATGIG